MAPPKVQAAVKHWARLCRPPADINPVRFAISPVDVFKTPVAARVRWEAARTIRYLPGLPVPAARCGGTDSSHRREVGSAEPQTFLQKKAPRVAIEPGAVKSFALRALKAHGYDVGQDRRFLCKRIARTPIRKRIGWADEVEKAITARLRAYVQRYTPGELSPAYKSGLKTRFTRLELLVRIARHRSC